MITDNGLRLATAEVTPNGGASPGGLGAASVSLALDESGLTTRIRTFRDIGAGQTISLAFNVTTAFTCSTFGATLEFQLVSLPIAASLLTNATTSGKALWLNSVPLDIADGDPDLADTLTIVGHGLPLGTPIHLSNLVTTTGVATSTIYYVVPTTADRFKLATSLANAIAGTTIDLQTGDGTATVNFIPTIHGASGLLPLYNAGVPTNQGPLRAGTRFHVPIRPHATLTPERSLPGGQTLSMPRGAGPTSGLIAANAQRYYYLRYVPSHTITAGAVTCDLVLDAGNALNYLPIGTEVVG